jgi:ABC-2 type transport system permease protein
MIALAIAKRIFIQMFRDKRTLALMWFAPLMIFTLMYFLFTSSGSDTTYKVGVYNLNPEIVENLEDNHLETSVFPSGEQAEGTIKNNQLVAFIAQKADGSIEITYENSAPAKSAVVRAKLQGALVKRQLGAFASLAQQAAVANPNLAQAVPQQTAVTEQYLYGEEDSDYFTTISPILLGFFIFFLVFLISGMALLRERTTGTLDKLLAAPVRRWEIIAGYLLGYGFFAFIQTLLLVEFVVHILHVTVAGNLALVMVITFLSALLALSFGVLLSTFAASEFQMVQFIPVVIIPQIFFSGIIEVGNLAEWLQFLARFMPLYYIGNALQSVMIKGGTLMDIGKDLAVIVLFISIFTILNVLGLKRYRKI